MGCLDLSEACKVVRNLQANLLVLEAGIPGLKLLKAASLKGVQTHKLQDFGPLECFFLLTPPNPTPEAQSCES